MQTILTAALATSLPILKIQTNVSYHNHDKTSTSPIKFGTLLDKYLPYIIILNNDQHNNPF
jgi:hypothetical protein